MSLLRRLLAKLKTFGRKKRKKGDDDASIYPMF